VDRSTQKLPDVMKEYESLKIPMIIYKVKNEFITERTKCLISQKADARSTNS